MTIINEVIKGCKRCGQMPKFSTYNFDGRNSASVVCCSIITCGNMGGGINSAISRWNAFNIESKTTFKLNRQTNQWEPYEPPTN